MNSTWPQEKLGGLLTQNDRSERVVAGRNYSLLGVRLAGQGPFLRKEKTGEQIQASNLSLVKSGDFIYSRLFAWRGAFGLIAPEYDGSYVSNEFPTFTIERSRLDPDYLRFFFARSSVWSEVEAYCTGTTKASRNRFKEQFFRGMSIPLPPLPEQRRIVARVEQLSAKIEEARVLREHATEESNHLAAQAGAAIFSETKWPLRTIEKTVGRANLKNGISLKSMGEDSKVRCLRLSSLRNGRIDCSDVKPVTLTLREAEPYLVRKGDVFVVRGNGSKELVGRAGIVGNDCEGVIFPDLFIRVPLSENEVLGSFFVSVWNSNPVRKAIEESAKTTSGIWKINQGHIASIAISVPPISEQRRIVAYLDNIQAKLVALKTMQEETAKELDALMPSILSKAFAGEL